MDLEKILLYLGAMGVGGWLSFVVKEWVERLKVKEERLREIPKLLSDDAPVQHLEFIDFINSRRRRKLPRFWAHQFDLSYLTMYKRDLRGQNLYGAKLFRADLHEADLAKVDLRKVDLHKANLEKADLSSARLYKQELRPQVKLTHLK